MSDEDRTRGEVESPCIKLCVVDPATRLCIGCRRSLDEIAAWGGMSEGDRRAVMAELPERRVGGGRRGGRAGRVR